MHRTTNAAFAGLGMRYTAITNKMGMLSLALDDLFYLGPFATVSERHWQQLSDTSYVART